MKSLRTQFILIFIALALLISLSVGITMYIQYSQYVLFSAHTTLESVAVLIDSNYPVLAETEYIKEEGKTDSEAYIKLLKELEQFNNAFGFTFIYLVENSPDGYLFLLDTADLWDDEKTFMTYYEEDTEYVDAAAESGELQITDTVTADEWGIFISAYIPIEKDGQVRSILCLDYDMTKIYDLEKRAMTSLAIALIIAVLISIVIAFIVAASFIRPVKTLQKAALELADMNLQIQLESTRKDEMGDMQRSLMTIRDNFRENIESIELRLNELTALTESLDISMDKSVSDMEVIFHSMQDVKSQADMQMDSVQQTSSSVEEIIQNINSLNRAIQAQAVNLNESSAAIEEMVGNIHSIRTLVHNANETANQLSGSAEQGKDKMALLNSELKRVSALSEKLQEANGVISGIANQTNILAMNAAIEAAHAGDVGKGFAVVSEEVRKLAELTGEESAAISREVQEIEESLSELVSVSDETAYAFDVIYKGITDIDETFNTVTQAITEQDTGGRQILESLKSMNELAEEVRSGSGEMQTGSSMIFDEIEKLQATSREVNESVQNVHEVSRDIEASLANAKDIAAKTREHLEFTKKTFNID
ncbi:methyl-accepting chemotaxis protein [Brucepastera parasyntrophica]|uniref:methyl-accepting chemotaxis protein n=1 Tax=Brucepastera parasyntrophica TaxID=2880008 RepID=UPI00210BB4E8|nr:HAMP domain-containing methyl-accepting chemotaxis protein [Brucepastera parasyntrophica]ULQ60569.1 methyl-accepting chemotaxis protein [Brucepastera parasyntrophica]